MTPLNARRRVVCILLWLLQDSVSASASASASTLEYSNSRRTTSTKDPYDRKAGTHLLQSENLKKSRRTLATHQQQSNALWRRRRTTSSSSTRQTTTASLQSPLAVPVSIHSQQHKNNIAPWTMKATSNINLSMLLSITMRGGAEVGEETTTTHDEKDDGEVETESSSSSSPQAVFEIDEIQIEEAEAEAEEDLEDENDDEDESEAALDEEDEDAVEMEMEVEEANDEEEEEDDEIEVIQEEETDATDVSTTEVAEYDTMLTPSSLQSMGVTLGVMLLTRRLDFTDKKIAIYARVAFLSYVVVAQLFYAYVRIQAKRIGDRTAITMENPLANLVKGQINSALSGGSGDMVKVLANKFLSSQSSVMEYDIAQSRKQGSGMVFTLAFLWFLHFKMNQIQPLFYQTATGILNLVYSPLFQVYVLGRNLERPFKVPNPLLDSATAASESNKESATGDDVAVETMDAESTDEDDKEEEEVDDEEEEDEFEEDDDEEEED